MFHRWWVLVAAVAASGCATVNPREPFANVQTMLAARLPYQTHWLGDAEADRAATEKVDALLAAPLDADAAVQIALLNNRRLQAAYESLGVAQAELVGAGLLRNPIFSGSLRLREAGADPVNLEFGVAVEFLDVLFVPMRRKVAVARLDQTKAQVAATVLDLAAETTAAFLTLQSAEQTAELRRQVEASTAASLEIARRQRAAGGNRPLDLANEAALHEEARLARAASELDASQRREALSRLMGVTGAQTQWKIAGRMPEPTEPETPIDGLEDRAVAASLDLRASKASIATSLAELGIARPFALLSGLEAGVDAERDDGEWEVGPSIALPLPIFDQGSPAIEAAKAQARAARHRYLAAVVDVRTAARVADLRVRALRQQVNDYREQLLPLRESIVEQTQLQYNAMQVGAFQLLQAKRDQIETAARYLNVLRDYWIARAQRELILNDI